MTTTIRPRALSSLANIDRPISVVELFTIGIGPSSSHTVGPMRAAKAFAESVADRDVTGMSATLHGSLALTGRGHASDTAVLVGLSGWAPEVIDPNAIAPLVAAIRKEGTFELAGVRAIPFDVASDLVFDPSFLPAHPNGMTFVAHFADGTCNLRHFYSIGGGAIIAEGEEASRANVALPYPFSSGAQMLALTAERGCSVADLERANEAAWRDPAETTAFLDRVRDAMVASIRRGTTADGVLPGGLKVRRRAKDLHEKLAARGPRSDPSAVFDWVSLWALAVNEENAGAAGWSPRRPMARRASSRRC